MFRFETLEIWKLSIEYADHIYKVSESFPEEEKFGLTSQLRRAAVSISTNIAEGSGADSAKDYKNFLNISTKSTLETVSLSVIAAKRKLISESVRLDFYEEAERLIRKIRAFKKALS